MYCRLSSHTHKSVPPLNNLLDRRYFIKTVESDTEALKHTIPASAANGTSLKLIVDRIILLNLEENI